MKIKDIPGLNLVIGAIKANRENDRHAWASLSMYLAVLIAYT